MVNRHVVGGVGVVFAPDVFGQVIEGIGGKMFVALEHHVLEEVSKTAPPLRIILRADVIPDLDRDGRARMIFDRVNFESVGKRLVLKMERGSRHRGLLRFRLCRVELGDEGGQKCGGNEREFHGKLDTIRATSLRRIPNHIGSRAAVGLTGLEPVTLRLSSACSNQLSYRPGRRKAPKEENSDG